MQAGNRLPPDERELMATPVPTGKRILAVSTSTDQYTTVGYRTGLWLGELTHFYDEATEAGHEVRIASIAGGRIPLDPESLGPLVLKQGGTHRRYADRDFMDLLADSARLVEATEEPLSLIHILSGPPIRRQRCGPSAGSSWPRGRPRGRSHRQRGQRRRRQPGRRVDVAWGVL